MSAETSIVLGLDLGRQRDFAALAALRCEGAAARVTGLQRWPLGTEYPALLDDVGRIVEASPTRPALVVDATGVGVGFVDFAKRANLSANLIPVTATSGARERMVDGVCRVPKANVMGALRSMLAAHLLSVTSGIAGADDLRRELAGIEVRFTKAGNEVSGAFRHGSHDDLTYALALACWLHRRRAGL